MFYGIMISVGSNPYLSPDYVPQKKETDVNAVSNPACDGYKKITGGQIKDILATPQLMRSDCYLVSTLKALAKSGFGKQMLKNSIKTSADGDTFEVQFKKYDDKNSYTVKNDSTYEGITGRHKFNPTGAVESATNYLVQDKFNAKPLTVRISDFFSLEGVPVEYNSASVYMENLTGKKPVSLGDDGFLSLSHRKEEAVKLLDKIGELPINRHSFVAGSKLFGTKDDIGSKHYYVVKKVDKDKKEVHLVNPRYADLTKGNIEKEIEIDLKNDGCSSDSVEICKNEINNMPKVYKLSYEQFLKNFRSLVGYFDEKSSKK